MLDVDTGSKKSSRNSSSNPYAGTQYEDMWNSNPYANNNREDSILDKLGNFFGIRTGADKWQDELDVRSKEYDAQIASIAREEAYNSESAKVARMKAAGLNPDLQGIEGASSASEFSEPETSPTSNSEVSSLGQAAGGLLKLGTDFSKGLLDVANLFLTLEGKSLQNEGLAIKNATDNLTLVDDAGSYFDMPDLDYDPSSENESDVKGTLLEGSEKRSDRIAEIATMLYGNPRKRSALKAKANLIAGMRGRKGTLSEVNDHLVKEATKDVLAGDKNVAEAQLEGRKSLTGAKDIESSLFRSALNDAKHQANIAEIEARWSSKEENQDLISEGMTNEAIQAAEIDPHQAAAATNAGFASDQAIAGAEIVESSARKKQAELDEENSRYTKEQLLIIEDLYDKWSKGNIFQKRKYRRQMKAALGYPTYHEPEIPFSGSVNYSGSRSTRRSSSEVVRRTIK